MAKESAIIAKLLESSKTADPYSVDDIENFVNNRNNTKSSLDELMQAIIGKINFFESELASSAVKIKTTEELLSNEHAENEKNKESIKESGELIAKLKTDNEDLLQQIDKIRKTGDSSDVEKKSIIDDLNKQIAANNAEIAELRKKNEKYAFRNDLQIKVIDQHIKKNEKLVKDLARLQNAIKFINNNAVFSSANLKKEIAELNDALNSVNEKISELENDKDANAKEIERLKNDEKRILEEELAKVTELHNYIANAENERLSLNEKLSQLSVEIETLSNANKKLQDEINNLSGDTSNLNDELIAKNAELASLNEKNSILNAQIDALSGENGDVNKELTTLNEQNNKLNERITELTDQINKLNLQIDNNTREHGDRIAELQNQIENNTHNHDNRVAELQNQIDNNTREHEERVADLQNQINNLNSNAINLNDELSAKNADLVSLNEKNNKLNAQIDALSGENGDVNNKLASLFEQNNNLNEKIAELTEQIEKLNLQIVNNTREYEARIAELQNQIENNNRKQGELIDELQNQIKNNALNSDERDAEMQKQIADKVAEIEKNNKTIENLNEQLKQFESEIIQYSKQYDALLAENAEQKTTIAQLRKDLEDLTSKKSELEGRIDDLNTQLMSGDDINNTILAEKNKLQNELDTIQKELANKNEALNKLTELVSSIREAVEIAKNDDKEGAIVEKINTLKKNNKDLTAENQAHKDAISVLEKGIDDLAKSKNENNKSNAAEILRLKEERNNLLDKQKKHSSIIFENNNEIKKLSDLLSSIRKELGAPDDPSILATIAKIKNVMSEKIDNLINGIKNLVLPKSPDKSLQEYKDFVDKFKQDIVKTIVEKIAADTENINRKKAAACPPDKPCEGVIDVAIDYDTIIDSISALKFPQSEIDVDSYKSQFKEIINSSKTYNEIADHIIDAIENGQIIEKYNSNANEIVNYYDQASQLLKDNFAQIEETARMRKEEYERKIREQEEQEHLAKEQLAKLQAEKQANDENIRNRQKQLQTLLQEQLDGIRKRKNDAELAWKRCVAEQAVSERIVAMQKNCEKQKKSSVINFKETIGEYNFNFTIGVADDENCNKFIEGRGKYIDRLLSYTHEINNSVFEKEIANFKAETKNLEKVQYDKNYDTTEIKKCLETLVGIYKAQLKILCIFRELYENTQVNKDMSTSPITDGKKYINDYSLWVDFNEFYKNKMDNEDSLEMNKNAKKIAELLIQNEKCDGPKIKELYISIRLQNLRIKNLVYSALGSIRVIFKIRGPANETHKSILINNVDGEKYIKINYNGEHKNVEGKTFTNNDSYKENEVYDQYYDENKGYNTANFQSTYTANDNNNDVYDKKINDESDTSLKELLADFLNGINVTAYAYGGSGAGKTYTLIKGNKANGEKGIINLFADDVINAISKDKNDKYLSLGISILELVPYGNGEKRILRKLKNTNYDGTTGIAGSVEGVEFKEVVNFPNNVENYVGPYWKDLLTENIPTAYRRSFDERKRNKYVLPESKFTKLMLWEKIKTPDHEEDDTSISYEESPIKPKNKYSIVHNRTYIIPESLEVRDLYNLCDDEYSIFKEDGNYNTTDEDDTYRNLIDSTTCPLPDTETLPAAGSRPKTASAKRPTSAVAKRPTSAVAKHPTTASANRGSANSNSEFDKYYKTIDSAKKSKLFTITTQEKTIDISRMQEEIKNILDYTFHEDNRQTGRTPFNPVSSRSHAFVEFHLTLKNDKGKIVSAKAMIADLAGIEEQLGNSVEILNYISALSATSNFIKTATATKTISKMPQQDQNRLFNTINASKTGTDKIPETLFSNNNDTDDDNTIKKNKIEEFIYNKLCGKINNDYTLRYGYIHKYIKSIIYKSQDPLCKINNINFTNYSSSSSIKSDKTKWADNIQNFLASFSNNNYTIENITTKNNKKYSIFNNEKHSKIKDFEIYGYNIRIDNVKKIINQYDSSIFANGITNLYITDHLNEDNTTWKKLHEIVALERTMYFTSFSIVWSLRYLINFIKIYNKDTFAIIKNRNYDEFYNYIEGAKVIDDKIIDNHKTENKNIVFKSCKEYNTRGCITEKERQKMTENGNIFAGFNKDSTGNYKYKFITTNEMFPYKLDNDKRELFDKNSVKLNNFQNSINNIISNIQNVDTKDEYNITYNNLQTGKSTFDKDDFINVGLWSAFIEYVLTSDGKKNIIATLGAVLDRNQDFENEFEKPIVKLFSFFTNFIEGYNAGAELIGYLRSQFFYNKQKKNTKIIMICMASPAATESGYSNEYITIPTCRFAMQIADIGGNVNLSGCGISGGGSLNELIRSAAKQSGGIAGISANIYDDLLSDHDDNKVSYVGGNDEVPHKRKVKRRVRKLSQKQEALQSAEDSAVSVDARVSLPFATAQKRSSSRMSKSLSHKNPESKPSQKEKPLSQKKKALLSAAKHDVKIVDKRVDPPLIMEPIIVKNKSVAPVKDPSINPSEVLQKELFKKPKKLVKKKVRVRKDPTKKKEKMPKNQSIEEEFNAIVVSDSDDS
jgi:chromosome segregation ATPase